MNDDLLSPKDAALAARVSASLIYQWCQEGLPHYRFGSWGRRGRIYIRLSDLLTWIESKKVIRSEESSDWP
jgi:hypothetical protein